MKSQYQNLPLAKIDNAFVYNARYQLTAKEAKVILYLISKINPVKQSRLHEQIIAVKELEKVLKEDGKKWGGLYSEMLDFQDRIMSRTIKFPTDIEIGGQVFPGAVNWFQYIAPVQMENGQVGVRFLFSEMLQPFLLNLKEYVGIDILEVVPLQSSFSIRMFQVFRAHRNRMAKHQQKSKLKYEIEELKILLGVSGKYSDYSNFKKRVLNTLVKEINQHTGVGVKYSPLKKGRRIVAIEFEFWDKNGRNQQPLQQQKLFTELTYEQMTFSQVRAFNQLVAYGVNDGIALQMIEKVQGSEFRGFEDWYFQECIKIVDSKSKKKLKTAKPGVLVNWFIKLKIFEQGDNFAKITEILQQRKKQLEKENPTAWSNRLSAKNMTAAEFRDFQKK